VNVLIGALVAATVISISVVIYLNVSLVRARHQITVQESDLRSTKRLRERFIVSATHELSTPLTVAEALADALAENRANNLTQQQKDQISEVQRNNRRLSEMVNVMIQSSVAGSDDDLRTESVKYSEFMLGAIKSSQNELELQGVRLEWSVFESDDSVSIDSEQMSKVLSNLLINASQNSPDGAIVFVSTERFENTIKNLC
jgi:signal transduction histidine kinase